MKRVVIYVDGFNLYYGLLKPNPRLKWLDLAALGAVLRPGFDVTVRYFTAKVRPVPDPASRERQRLYLKALETLHPKVTIHFGHFTAHQVRMALVAPTAPNVRTALVWKTEEKGSDVNIATFLLLDGHVAGARLCRLRSNGCVPGTEQGRGRRRPRAAGRPARPLLR